jgi:hypothetical protein
MRPIYLLLLTLLTLATGCAASSDEPTWHYAYRLEGIPHDQGCTVARSVEPAVVELRWPDPVPDSTGGFTGWFHPCQDGTDRLCPDLSAPGMFVDVYTRGDVDPHDFVVTEACR